MRRIILVFAIAVMAIVAGCGEKDNGALVVAKVDTREITVADFEGVSDQDVRRQAGADLRGHDRAPAQELIRQGLAWRKCGRVPRLFITTKGKAEIQ